MAVQQHSTLGVTNLHQPFPYGPFADRTATPAQGQWYFCSDENILLRCVTAGIWEPHTWMPAHYYREDAWQYKGIGAAADRYTLQTPTKIAVTVGTKMLHKTARTNLALSDSGSWDTTAVTDYTVAATRAGVDFYIYAVDPGTGVTAAFLVSANSTTPSGYTADTSRKVGGFHCLCVSVGAIGGHDLTGFVQGDILPMSVWDLEHRPMCEPEGMVWSEMAQVWVDIYLQSGTGTSTVSSYNKVPVASRMWYDHRDDGAAVGKRMMKFHEFTVIADGSNEETLDNVASGTGGNSDTAGRRMIADIGCEDCCGWVDQYLDIFNRSVPGGAYDGSYNWQDLATNKGSIYYQGASGLSVSWIAGGRITAANAGTMSRSMTNGWDRDQVNAYSTCRFVCRPK